MLSETPKEPLVSILINNYNYAEFIKSAIDSALNQSYRLIEVIVVDDGSTDTSREVILSYGDRIKSIFQENGGQASAFNAGFKSSQGDIICFLDSDDKFSPRKVEKVVEAFGTDGRLGWCFHPLKLVGKDIKTEIHKSLSTDYSGKYDIRPHLKKGKLSGKLPFQGVATSGTCFRKSLLEKILPMPLEIKITSDDYIKYVSLGISEGYIILEELSDQLIHANNAYTLRKDKQKLVAKIRFLTAYWMRKNFPELSKFSNSVFVSGNWVLQRNTNLIDDEIKRLKDDYLSLISWPEIVKIQTRLIYHRFKL